MVSFNLSLPDSRKKWAEEQARSRKFGTVDSYVEDLIARDRDRQNSKAEFEALIAEGIDSGMSERGIDEILAEARRRSTVRGDAKL